MIECQVHRDILEIILNNPPVNALGADMRCGLMQAIADAQSISTIKAIVIRGAGKIFSGGADIREFGTPPLGPSLADLINAIEASAKPVVAAIYGIALGGGLELALGCHYRIAHPDAKLGLPEVTLGILPGAGGTQRLPRLIGAEAALDMIVSGGPVTAAKAAELGVVDRLTGGADVRSAAIAFAEMLDGEPRRTGELALSADPALFDRFTATHARRIAILDAPKACIEAVRAATELPLDLGLRKERALFVELVGGDQSRALRHVFFAERAAARIDGLSGDPEPRPITRVGVIGAGTMGGGIAMNFLSADIPVTIVELERAALDRGVALIRKNYEAAVAKGRLSVEQVESSMQLLTAALDFDALCRCDLVIEAVYENMEVKKQIFARLDKVASPGAILASNTSYLSIDEIADATGRPQDVLGLHFFSPANVMKLVEVVRGAKTSQSVLAAGMALARRIGKVPVASGVCHGFIGNRMLKPRVDGAIAMLAEGATAEQIDRVSVGLGMPMGPIRMTDLAGVDIGWHRDPQRIETIRDALNAAGRWGQKTGGGFYDYDEQRRPVPSPVTQAIIEDFRVRMGIFPRVISEAEIVARTFYVMINEAAKILEEGIAQRASDIDVVWTHGYGWPRHTGGPIYWAEQIGLATIVDGLNRHAPAFGSNFALSPLLVACAAERRLLEP